MLQNLFDLCPRKGNQVQFLNTEKSCEQQQINILPPIHGKFNPPDKVHQVNKPTDEAVVVLATLPPSKMAHKITSLRNKLVNKNEKQVTAGLNALTKILNGKQLSKNCGKRRR